MIHIRALRPEDEPLLPQFLALVAHEENVETVLSHLDLARYVGGWGREGDTAVVAQDEETREVVGMAWARFWTPDNRGFGWVDELTPELAAAVKSELQNQGVGARLIEALKCRLRAIALDVRWDALHQKWVSAPQKVEAEQLPPLSVSLNVRADSPAVRLYKGLGFTRIAGSERTNRTGGQSFTMNAPLHEGQWHHERLQRSFVLAQGDAPRFFVHVEFLARLRFDVFTSEEIERFEGVMGSLPGAGQSMGSGADWKTTFNYYGLDTGKMAIHDANLFARINSHGLRVAGDVHWKQWCEWEDAFLAGAHDFPHEMRVRSL